MSRAPTQARWSYAFCVALFLVTFFLAATIPPFQAPDEFEHVKREYMLSRGQIMPHSKNGSPSGGRVDKGLLQYMDYFTPMKGNASRKASSSELSEAAQVRWTGSWSFETTAGSGSYFPLLYAPEAMGFLVGRSTGMTVGHSYRLARYLSVATCMLLLIAAIRLWPPPPIVLALFALPMNLFLLSSAVLDGMALATFVLSMSAFFRVIQDRERASQGIFLTMTIGIGLVAACRANALPMLLFPFIAAWYSRNRRSAIYAAVAAILVVGWTIYTVGHTVYPAGARNMDNSGRLLGYISNPLSFLTLLFDTVTDTSIVSFYGYSFIGILGWFDAPLPLPVYPVLAGMLLATFLATAGVRGMRGYGLAHGAILLAVIGSILLTFLALLVQWTPAGATRIDGVQGRYFMIPAAALGFVFASHAWQRPRPATLIAGVIVAILFFASAAVTVSTVVSRYHTIAEQPQAPEASLSVSPPLTRESPIELRFSEAQRLDPAPITALAVRLGTYMKIQPGTAELRLWTAKGETFSVSFALSSLTDNAYRWFELDGQRYVRGEISSTGGDGISAYQSALNGGTPLTCVVIQDSAGVHTIPGCPMDPKVTDVRLQADPAHQE